jgi:hypothetical protein
VARPEPLLGRLAAGPEGSADHRPRMPGSPGLGHPMSEPQLGDFEVTLGLHDKADALVQDSYSASTASTLP